MIYPVILALLVFALTMSLFSLFVAGMVRRPQHSEAYPPGQKLGYYSAQHNRRVYSSQERQPS